MSASELVAILLVLAAGITIIVLFTGIRSNIDNIQDGTCAAQVRAAAETQRIFGRDYNVSTPACQTRHLTIRRNELPRNDEAARDRVRYLLAEEMRKCWDQWGRGELDLFAGEGEYCSFCANINFDEGVQQLMASEVGSRNTVANFSGYLASTKVPGRTVTYAEHLSGVQRSEDGSDVRNLPATAIELQKNYTVLFTYSKVDMTDDVLKYWGNYFGVDITPGQYAKISAVAAGTAVGGVVGAGTAAGAATFLAGMAGTAGATAGTVLAATGPVGWAIIGGAIGVVAIGTAAVVSYSAIKAGTIAATATGSLAYIYARSNEEFFIMSATYITPNDPNSVYVKSCGQAAEPTRSP